MTRPSLLPLVTSALVLSSLPACSSTSRTVDGTGDGGAAAEGGTTAKSVADFVGDQQVGGGTRITANRTLTADKDYLMKGTVYVPAGVTLTIEKGTTIFGDKGTLGTLVVQPGGRLEAVGTADQPIVFTSYLKEGQKAAGDWGGVILLGKAPLNSGNAFIEGLAASDDNKYGGTDPADSSGRLSYVRIEYSGAKIGADNEINGLTLGAVGSGTQLDHIQVRHTLDDCFEFFGGTVNAKYLVCAYNQDDGIDIDNGFSGKIQFFVLQQDPNVDDEMNGFEWDNDAQKSANTPITNPTVYNVTLCGQDKSGGAKRKFGMLLRRNTAGTVRNAVAWGFDAAVDVRDTATHARARGTSTPTLTVQSSQFFEFTGPSLKDGLEIVGTGDEAAFSEADWLKTAANKNTFDKDPAFACNDAENPRFAPAAVLTDTAEAPPADGFFDTNAKYVGAFKDGSDAWATTGKWVAWTKPGF